MSSSTIDAGASPQQATEDYHHYLRPHYQPGIPAAIEVPDAPLSDLLETAARFYPDRVAIDFLGATLTYRELLEASERAAQVLRTSGVHKGDRVALIMPNCPQHAVALYGALRIGAVVAEHNPLAPAEEIRSQLDAHGAQVVIAWEKGIDLITDPTADPRAGGDPLKGRTVFSVDLSAAMPVRLRAALRLPVERARQQRAALKAEQLPAGVRSWDKEVTGAHPDPLTLPLPGRLRRRGPAAHRWDYRHAQGGDAHAYQPAGQRQPGHRLGADAA